jgi:hypothetical protein
MTWPVFELERLGNSRRVEVENWTPIVPNEITGPGDR